MIFLVGKAHGHLSVIWTHLWLAVHTRPYGWVRAFPIVVSPEPRRNDQDTSQEADMRWGPCMDMLVILPLLTVEALSSSPFHSQRQGKEPAQVRGTVGVNAWSLDM